MKFNKVVSNPPYSVAWSSDKKFLYDPRFKKYKKLAPKSKADYSFILHDLFEIDDEGTAVIILPHGILFRGAAEGSIRQQLIEDNQIDAIIGLPANLFDVATIPVLIMILKKNRTDNSVFFIDASREFEKGKNQNKLTTENIKKIVTVYQQRKDVDKYAHLATFDEMKDNDFNLNIPRYVDNFEPEPQVDVKKLKEEFLNTRHQINNLERKIKSTMGDLYGTTVESQVDLEIMRTMFDDE